jgi:hypothetical protein
VADIADVAPTVLAALEHSVPGEMDGRPINAIVGDRWTLSEGDGKDLVRREESLEDEEIRKSLEALGYF